MFLFYISGEFIESNKNNYFPLLVRFKLTLKEIDARLKFQNPLSPTDITAASLKFIIKMNWKIMAYKVTSTIFRKNCTVDGNTYFLMYL